MDCNSVELQRVVQGSTADERKAALRKHMLAQRNSIPQAEREKADAAIRDQVLSLQSYGESSTVFAYLSFGTEVETRGIIEAAWRDGKEVALPRCVGPRQMRWYRVADFGNLEKSNLGVEEPRMDPAAEVDPADRPCSIALVPGMAFDDDGYRLGYGGGFYDAFLADFPGVPVGLCRAVQRVDSLAALQVVDTHDLPARLVVFG